MPSANLAARLESVLGASRVRATEAELLSFTVDGFSPSAIVLPASAAEVEEVVRFAASEGLAIISC